MVVIVLVAAFLLLRKYKASKGPVENVSFANPMYDVSENKGAEEGGYTDFEAFSGDVIPAAAAHEDGYMEVGGTVA